jgi:hypothetical protein
MNQSIDPWQQNVTEWCALVGNFPIKMVYDPNQFVNYAKIAAIINSLAHAKLAVNLPCNSGFKNVMQCAYHAGSANAFTVIMPRVTRANDCSGFYCAMESLSDGVAYDTNFEKRRMNRPQIIVFSNTLPNFTLLPERKWEIWEMTSDKTLSRVESNQIE